jgi:hypothetical protein
MRADQIETLRQTHKTVSTWAPLLTAAVAVSGAVLASMERQAERTEPQRHQVNGLNQLNTSHLVTSQLAAANTRVVPVVSPVSHSMPVSHSVRVARSRRLTLFGYLATLIGLLFRAVFAVTLVFAIVALYFASNPTWRAIELTALVLLALYLAERVARARRAA